MFWIVGNGPLLHQQLDKGESLRAAQAPGGPERSPLRAGWLLVCPGQPQLAAFNIA